MYRIWIAVLLFLCCNFPNPQASAEESSIQQSDMVQKEVRIESREIPNLEKELEILDIQLNQLVEQLREIQVKIDQNNKEMEDTQKVLDQIRKSMEIREVHLKQRMVIIYEQNTTPLMMILEVFMNTKGFMDLLIRWDFVQLVIQQDTRLLEEYHQYYLQFEKHMKTLKENLQQLQLLEEKTRIAKEEYEAKSIQRNMVLAQMVEREGGLEEVLEEQEQMMNGLLKKIQDQVQPVLVSDTPSIEDIWFWPLSNSGVVTSLFGKRTDPITQEIKYHSGIDVASVEGTLIFAVGKGKVVIAQYQSGYGNLVAIDHGKGIVTMYAHIRHGGIRVKVGQEVEAGQPLAEVGSTGRSTGPHLHFEVVKNGKNENPVYYLNAKVKAFGFIQKKVSIPQNQIEDLK